MEEYYNLVEPQRNIYLREEYYNGTSINNISFTYCINKKLDVEICKKVINKIIEINDGLRIQISKFNNEVVQYLKKYENEEIEVIDYSNKDMEFIKEEMAKNAKIPFVFLESKLYNFKIYLLPNNKTGIYIKLHHIIADAWVTKIILKQFNEIYNSLSDNVEHIYENNSYINFINKEKEYLSSDSYKKDKEYWEEYLKDVPEAIQFKDVALDNKSNAIRYTKALSKELSNNINYFCRQKNITPYSFFIAVYSIYLYKTLGKSEFMIGTPLLNRKDYSEKQTVGMYVSTIPFKIKIEERDTIDSFCKRISTDIRNALRHQRYPYNKMLEYVRNKNENSNNLFNTILSFQNMKPDKEFINYEYNHFWNFSGNQQSSFEIHISDYNDTGKYLFNLDFKDDLVTKEEIPLICKRLEFIIRNIIKNKNININELEFIPETEKLRLDVKYNKEDFKKNNQTLIQMFEEQVRKNPNKIALKYKDKKLTYTQLQNEVNIMAFNFIKAGIKEKMPVTLLLDRSLEMIISMLAVLKIGAYYIPIDPAWPFERLNFIVNDINSKYIITNKKHVREELKVNWLDVENISRNTDISNVEDKSKLENLVYVIYTSGSTGKPKGTLIKHKNVVGLLASTNKIFNQTSKDIWTLFHTYTFDFSAWEIYGSLLYGATLVIVPKETTINPKEFLNLLIEEKVTILNQTPAYFYKVIEEEKISNLDRKELKVRLIILGGEAVHAEPLKYWKEKYKSIKIYNGYGPTETTIFAVMGEITKKDIQKNIIYIGYPLTNYRVQIMNQNLEVLPIGCIGEICISGTGVCGGYLNNEELTNEKFVKNLNKKTTIYKSGDIGYFDINKRIKYIGRNDNQVKIRGFRIEIEEIEKELLKCKDVNKAVVFPIEDQNYTKKLVGFIETNRENYIEEVTNQIRKKINIIYDSKIISS